MQTIKTVDVGLGARGYQVRIGRGLLSMRDELTPWLGGRQVCIVTDANVAELYLDVVRELLADKYGGRIIAQILPPGETVKTLASVDTIFDKLLQARCDRETPLIALGGGVVGDIAGFAAACYQRGAPYVQIPTTLLAQVDSSVGGKTGVNHALGKNMIGAFYQPRRVLADTATLDTLDARQFSAGMAEVIKYGLINDAEFFTFLEHNITAAMARDADILATIIQRSCENKSRIVEQDERESGARALLNLGHTFAHAIEAGSGYQTWLHGEAVGVGLAMAARLSARLNLLADDSVARIEQLLGAAGLSAQAFGAKFDDLSVETMLDLMRGDKKNRGGKLRLVVLTAIGRAKIIDDCPREILAETIARYVKD